jgi:hypothetical protein
MSELNPTELEIAKIQQAAEDARQLLATEFQAQLDVIIKVIENWQQEFAGKFLEACAMLETRAQLEVKIIREAVDVELQNFAKRSKLFEEASEFEREQLSKATQIGLTSIKNFTEQALEIIGSNKKDA